MGVILNNVKITVDELRQEIEKFYAPDSQLRTTVITLEDLVSLGFLDEDRLPEQLIIHGEALFADLNKKCAGKRKKTGRRAKGAKVVYSSTHTRYFKRLVRAAINLTYRDESDKQQRRRFYDIFPMSEEAVKANRQRAQDMRDKKIRAHIEQAPVTEIKLKALQAQIKLLDNAKGERLSDSSIKATLAVLNQLVMNGLLDDRALRRDLLEDYESTDRRVREAIEKGGKSRSWIAILPRIRRAAELVSSVDVSSVSFMDYFDILLRRRYGETTSKHAGSHWLAKELLERHPEIDRTEKGLATTFIGWASSNRVPATYDSLQLLKLVCEHLKDAEYKLLRKTFYFQSVTPRKQSTSNREKFAFELTDAQLLEIDIYSKWRKHHVAPMNHKTHIIKSAFDDLEADLDFDFIAEEKWSSQPDGTCGSEETFLNTYRTAVYIWSTSYQQEASTFSMSALFDSKFIKAVYQEASSTGKYRSRTKVIVLAYEAAASGSFISEHYPPERTKTQDELTAYLGKYREFMRKYLDQIDKVYRIEKSDGKRNVDFILRSENPAAMDEAIAAELKNALDDAPDPRTHNRPRHKNGKPNKKGWDMYNSLGRIYTLYMMLGVLPMRIGNYCKLKLLKGTQTPDAIIQIKQQEKEPYLYQDHKGMFHVFVPRAYLKNRKGSKTEDIDMPLTGLARVINRYIKIRSDFLQAFGYEDLGYFFVASGNAIPAEKSVSELFSKYTRKAICLAFPELESEDLMGINPHGKRHMTATLFLNENPKEYAALSTLLMDSLLTVLKVYADVGHTNNAKSISQWSANRNSKAKSL